MQPYSIDFRQKIIEVYELERLSIRQLAKRFYVAKSKVSEITKTISTNRRYKTQTSRRKRADQAPGRRSSYFDRNS